MRQDIKELFPGADNALSRSVQFKIAWRKLLDEDAAPGERAHAKCWLTYRAVDGLVSPEHWLEKVYSVNVGYHINRQWSIRWGVSQAAAEVYLRLLRQVSIPVPPEGVIAHYVDAGDLHLHAPAVLCVLRVALLSAYDSFLKDDHEAAKATINEAFRVWRQVMVEFDAQWHYLRWLEMRDDALVLHALTLLQQAMGIVKLPNLRWCSEEWLMREAGAQPWAQCLRKLGSRSNRVF